MKIQENVSLATYSTMKLGGIATYLVVIEDEEQLIEALTYAKQNQLTTHITGTGSNTIYGAKGFNGLVIVNKIKGIKATPVDDCLELVIGAGEDWDVIVADAVKRGFSDIAALSLIPGTTGAAPIQNIGAYGQQVSDSIVSVRSYDTEADSFVELSKNDCGFSYRHSRFNTIDKGRFIITSIKLRYCRKKVSPPFYTDVSHYFSTHDIAEDSVTPLQLREAVSSVRVVKLPDPSTVSNCGSFFKNPVVSRSKYKKLLATHPELKAHETDDGQLKLYGAQLIELLDLKDYHDPVTGMATWKNQALVLVNESAKNTDDLITFRDMIISKVDEAFGITLVQEPEFIELA